MSRTVAIGIQNFEEIRKGNEPFTGKRLPESDSL